MKPPTSKQEAIEQRDRFKNAALKEHELMRTWQNRALAAEARLKLYDQRENNK